MYNLSLYICLHTLYTTQPSLSLSLSIYLSISLSLSHTHTLTRIYIYIYTTTNKPHISKISCDETSTLKRLTLCQKWQNKL